MKYLIIIYIYIGIANIVTGIRNLFYCVGSVVKLNYLKLMLIVDFNDFFSFLRRKLFITIIVVIMYDIHKVVKMFILKGIHFQTGH
jgi:hypothetical protein